MHHIIEHRAQLPTRNAAGTIQPGAWHCDLGTSALTWSDGIYEMFGYRAGVRLDRRAIVELYCDDSREELERIRAQAIADRRGFSFDAAIQAADGALRWLRITGVPLVQDGRVIGLHGTKEDITAERAELEALRRLAYHDAVTGLSNRTRFQHRFLDRPAGCRSLASVAGLVLFDMNRFKQINDGWGHPAGDACLAEFARRLQRAFPDALLAARIGGDEFAILLPHGSPEGPAVVRLSRAIPTLFAGLAWNGLMLPVHAAMGIATIREGETCDPAALYATADADLYSAKSLLRTRAGDRQPEARSA